MYIDPLDPSHFSALEYAIVRILCGADADDPAASPDMGSREYVADVARRIGAAAEAETQHVLDQQTAMARAFFHTWHTTLQALPTSKWTPSHSAAYQQGEARAAAMLLQVFLTRRGVGDDEECTAAWELIQRGD